jgi:hypothetical protein
VTVPPAPFENWNSSTSLTVSPTAVLSMPRLLTIRRVPSGFSVIVYSLRWPLNTALSAVPHCRPGSAEPPSTEIKAILARSLPVDDGRVGRNAVPHAEVVRDHDAIAEDLVVAAETCLQRRSGIEDAEPQPSLLVCRRSELTNVPSRTVTIQISAAMWIDQSMPIEVCVAAP